MNIGLVRWLRTCGILGASLVLGVLLGAGVALAHTDLQTMVTGWKVYEAPQAHTGSGFTYSYKQDHFAWANAARTHFIVDDAGHHNGSAASGVYFGPLQIFDEYGNHSITYASGNQFYCSLVNGYDAVTNISDWDYDGLNSQNDHVAAQQWIWKSNTAGCAGDSVEVHAMDWSAN